MGLEEGEKKKKRTISNHRGNQYSNRDAYVARILVDKPAQSFESAEHQSFKLTPGTKTWVNFLK